MTKDDVSYQCLLHSLLLPRRLKLIILCGLFECSNKTTYNWRQKSINVSMYVRMCHMQTAFGKVICYLDERGFYQARE